LYQHAPEFVPCTLLQRVDFWHLLWHTQRIPRVPISFPAFLIALPSYVHLFNSARCKGTRQQQCHTQPAADCGRAPASTLAPTKLVRELCLSGGWLPGCGIDSYRIRSCGQIRSG
jgi:hypothetical protein